MVRNVQTNDMQQDIQLLHISKCLHKECNQKFYSYGKIWVIILTTDLQ